MDALAGAAWTLVGTAPGALTGPADLDAWAGSSIPAQVPGTVAASLRAAHGVDAALTTDIDSQDWWWRTRIDASGAHLLVAEGLATVADVWVDGRQVLHSENMFRRSVLELADLAGPTDIVLRCAAPIATLGRRPRPRWKTTLIPEQRWRFLRTTPLGRVPTWAGTAAPAGPWRALRLETLNRPVVARQRVAARLDGTSGVVDVELDVRGDHETAVIRIGDTRTPLHRDDDGLLRCSVEVPDVQLWWPHTHGSQPRYEVGVSWDDGEQHVLTHVAFRTSTLAQTDGACSLTVNDVDVFVRGACWHPLDALSLQADPSELRAAVAVAREAGHNIVRVQGTWVYESDAFYAACDELGMLVWQDCVLSALDPPDTEDYTAELVAEITDLADRLAGRACVAVVCGGAETEQQPAMLGMTHQRISALADTIPGVLAERLPGVAYVSATPSGGAMPMHVATGVAQYFGVGAYLRPLLDVRAAGVRFAAECLAFSVPPESDAVLREFGSARFAGHDPRWKATVPRDVTASWDFEDVRDHYVRDLFELDPLLVRYTDPERYLDLGRAAICIAMNEVLTWWRRPRSECAGGIVLGMRDQVMGAGWGLLDAHGRAKAPLFALRPVLAALALLVSDDGADGMTVTPANDGPEPISAHLEVRIWSESGALLEEGSVAIELAAHSAMDVSLDAILGRFTDAGSYYRFGPRQRDMLHARLRHEDGTVLVSRTVELGHHLRPVTAGGVVAAVRQTGAGWVLDVSAERTVHWLAVDSSTHEPSESWFHLAPGERRRISLAPLPGAPGEPRISLRALDLAEFTVAVHTEEDVLYLDGGSSGIIEGWT